MDYTELSIDIIPQHIDSDVLTAMLADAGFESFSEENGIYKAYIQQKLFNQVAVEQILLSIGCTVFSFSAIADQNWNAVWESNFEPVVIAGRCYVRAPFHDPAPQYPYELLIEPQMSFGTAHHETTSQMISLLLDEPLDNKSVLDMGCGTGILAVLAVKLGAISAWAIDNDEWAYNNSIENVQRNNTPAVSVFLGDAEMLNAAPEFDVLLANINRNILLRDLHVYRKVLKDNSIVFMSGFYETDLDAIVEEAGKYDIQLTNHIVLNKWVAARFHVKA
jgi:ribosomal protein L11 methyltransferase